MSPSRDPLSPEDAIAAELVVQGRVIRLETRGRRSGQPRSVAVGFVETEAGDLLVAASGEDSHWARNLGAEPGCRVERDGSAADFRAIRLSGAERHQAIASLILRYGTPAERLGAGPAFRLTPVDGIP